MSIWPDLRNSKVIGFIRRFETLGHEITVHDPEADRAEARREFGVALDADELTRRYDLVLAAVSRAECRIMAAAEHAVDSRSASSTRVRQWLAPRQ